MLLLFVSLNLVVAAVVCVYLRRKKLLIYNGYNLGDWDSTFDSSKPPLAAPDLRSQKVCPTRRLRYHSFEGPIIQFAIFVADPSSLLLLFQLYFALSFGHLHWLHELLGR